MHLYYYCPISCSAVHFVERNLFRFERIEIRSTLVAGRPALVNGKPKASAAGGKHSRLRLAVKRLWWRRQAANECGVFLTAAHGLAAV